MTTGLLSLIMLSVVNTPQTSWSRGHEIESTCLLNTQSIEQDKWKSSIQLSIISSPVYVGEYQLKKYTTHALPYIEKTYMIV